MSVHRPMPISRAPDGSPVDDGTAHGGERAPLPLPLHHFPTLVAHAPLHYLDTAATCPTPAVVIDAVRDAMIAGGSAHRGLHRLNAAATAALEGARARSAALLGAAAADELVFVRSATEGLNLVAEGWARPRLGSDGAIVVGRDAHHSNLLPWRRICEATGAELRVAPLDTRGRLDLDALARRLDGRVVAVALTHVSNVTGAVTPLDEALALVRARAPQAAVVVDGAQAVGHLAVHLDRLGADFYVFSGHKAYGPQGIGAVHAPTHRWAETAPLLVGGGMVLDVRDDGLVLAEGPARFEAGTANVPGAVGLAAGLAFVAEHRRPAAAIERTAALRARLAGIPGVRLLGDPDRAVGAVSFTVDGVHPHDVGAVLAERHVAVRVGHHCARPLLDHLGAASAVRASIGLHTREADIDALVEGLAAVRRLFDPAEAR